jgi:hypothetical protein
MQIDWSNDLECKVWGIETWNHNWLPVAKIQKQLNGNYRVWDINGAEEFWGTVLSDGKIIFDGEEVGQVRNKRTVDDNNATMLINGESFKGRVSINLNAFEEATTKPDNRAVFYFEKKGDVYTLTGWKNVMSGSGIIRKYGQDVYRAYIGDYNQQSFIHEIYTTLPCDVFLRVHENKSFVLESGDVFSKEDYELIVDSCKKAGERLSKLVRDSKKPEKIEVVI